MTQRHNHSQNERTAHARGEAAHHLLGAAARTYSVIYQSLTSISYRVPRELPRTVRSRVHRFLQKAARRQDILGKVCYRAVSGLDFLGAEHTLFQRDYYRKQCSLHGLEIPVDQSAWLHFYKHGCAARIPFHPLVDMEYIERRWGKAAFKAPVMLVYNIFIGKFDPNPLFSATHYRERYPDIKQSKVSPFKHYLDFGIKEGRDPSAYFATSYFLHTISSAPLSDTRNPLEEYFSNPKEHSRHAHILFDPDYYLANLPESERPAASRDPLSHFAELGDCAYFSPHPLVDLVKYGQANPDVMAARLPPFSHIWIYGVHEGRPFLSGPTRKLLDAAIQRNPSAITRHQLVCRGALRGFADSCELSVKVLPYSALERTEPIPPPPSPIVSFAPPAFQGDSLPVEAVPVRTEGFGMAYQRNLVAFGSSRILCDLLTGTAYSDELADAKPGYHSPRGLVCASLGPRQPRLRLQTLAGSHKNGIILCCEYDFNYFHWTVEVLPRLRTIEHSSVPRDIPIFVSAGLHKNLLEALQRIVDGSRPIEALSPGVPALFDELYLPFDPVAVHDNYWGPIQPGRDSYIDPGGLLFVRERLLRSHRAPARRFGRRLFLSRSGAAIRKPRNMDAIEALVKRHGFSVVDPARLTLDEQIAALSSAEIIISPTGAALTNLIFCRPGTRALVFFCNHPGANPYFWAHIAEPVGVKLRTLLCPLVPVAERKCPIMFSVHEDYDVPLAQVEAFLDDTVN